MICLPNDLLNIVNGYAHEPAVMTLYCYSVLDRDARHFTFSHTKDFSDLISEKNIKVDVYHTSDGDNDSKIILDKTFYLEKSKLQLYIRKQMNIKYQCLNLDEKEVHGYGIYIHSSEIVLHPSEIVLHNMYNLTEKCTYERYYAGDDYPPIVKDDRYISEPLKLFDSIYF